MSNAIYEEYKKLVDAGHDPDKILASFPPSIQDKIIAAMPKPKPEPKVVDPFEGIHEDHMHIAANVWEKAQRAVASLDVGRDFGIRIDANRTIRGKVTRAEIHDIRYNGTGRALRATFRIYVRTVMNTELSEIVGVIPTI